MIFLEEDEYGRIIRLKGFFSHREYPECPGLHYMAVYLAPDPEESGYVCPACRGFYRLEKRKGRKETFKKIGTVTIEKIE